MRIAVLDDIHQAYDRTAAVQRLRQRDDVELTIFSQPFGSPENLRDFDVLVANRERSRFPREFFEALPNLKLLVQTGTHAYHVDFEAAHDQGVKVTSAGGGSNGAGELTIGLMLALVRQVIPADAGIRRGEWPAPLGLSVEGKVLGLIGVGRVGAYVARIAQAMEMKLLAWTPSLTDERAAKYGAERRDLDDLLRESDVVSVHAALSKESRGLIKERELGLMKPTAYLINTARGPIVDEGALVAALSEGRIAGAALDVFDEEPLPAGYPLIALPNVILTPHLGWPTDIAYQRFAASAAAIIETYLDGGDVPPWPGH
jgi:phosphoglycerate dehydrogenase-like enzyme